MTPTTLERYVTFVLLSLATSLAACGGPDAAPMAQTPAPAPAVAPANRAESQPLRLDDGVVPREVALELALDPSKEDFAGKVTIAVELARPTRTIRLHGKRLTVQSATVSAGPHRGSSGRSGIGLSADRSLEGPAGAGKEIRASANFSGELLDLVLPEELPAGPASIHIEYTGKAPTTDVQGLFRQSDGGLDYLYSQMEPTGARQAFPSFDEPRFKVPWQVTLRVPRGLIALSNTRAAREETAGEVTTVVFEKTRPLPTYLVAVAVGPFDLVDGGRAGKNQVPVRIAVPKGRAAEARYAARVTRELVAVLERYFDLPFPYEKLDQVAVMSFPGAMENAGLVTYGQSILLAKPNEETLPFQQRYARIAIHEIAHHWFGNQVTLAWWDDIWLNESFANFMEDRALADWKKDWAAPVDRVKGVQHAFDLDSLVSARKVHNPIARHEDIAGSFDAISYAKGGALLDMVEAWMGRPSFQRAIHAYLVAHAWGTATSKDFVAALAAQSRPELAGALESFLEQGGVPMVSLDLACQAGKPPELVLSQKRLLPIGSKGAADQRWTIPMCVGFPRGKKGATQCFLMTQAEERVALDSPGCPAWVDGNAGAHGYYRVRYARDLGKTLLERGQLDAAGRTAALFNLKAMVAAGHSPMSEQLALTPSLARDRDPDIVGVGLSFAEDLDPLVAAELRPSYQRYLATSFAGAARKAGWTARKGEPGAVAKLRARLLGVAALIGQDPALVASARAHARRYLARPGAHDPRLAAVALGTVMRAGAEPAMFDRLSAMFDASTDKQVRAALVAGMILSRDPAQRQRTLARLTGGKLGLEEMFTLIFLGMTDPDVREETWTYVVDHLDAIADALPYLVRPAISQLGGFFCDAEHRKTIDTVFRSKFGSLPGGQKNLTEVLERIDLCIERKKIHGADVAAFLRAQAPGSPAP